ncbi:hypothetical protein HHI36_022478 [Cryptolaemus montrouzieri]|uniref:Sulfatase N-terminal domain-containing protein n=1 Tax=Cryptolaemus montrouzieri TaxID=559131 RepID=A0ABD2N0C0_9CUCU
MDLMIFWAVLLGIISRPTFGKELGNLPHIIMIIGDDMGSNDVSYRGSNQVTTPNIDALGYNGVILDKHYTQAICTPSRAALLTGKYPIRTGMQGLPLNSGEDRHLPEGIQTLPQLLKDLGYSTHMVGKWHLGAARRNDTPTGKGFDTHFGYWSGYVGYFDYMIQTQVESINQVYTGFDLKEKFRDAWSEQGKYATDLFTEKALEVIENQDKNTPMFLAVTHLAVHTGKDNLVEVKDEKVMNDSFGYIQDLTRRKYVDALLQLDQSVGLIVEKLQEQNMLENSVVIFMSDNGAQLVGDYRNGGSNYPLRGSKSSLHDGGIRNAAVLYSPLLKQKGYVYEEILHITDWLPTLYSLAGGDLSSLKGMDGFDQWQSISENKPSKRDEILANINEITGYSGIIGYKGRYKIINGSISSKHDIFGPELEDNIDYDIPAILNSPVNKAIRQLNASQNYLNTESIQNLRKISSKLNDDNKCKNSKNRKNPEICTSFCLFDLMEDPCETENLIEDETKQVIISGLKARLAEFWKQLVPQTNKPVDVNSNPAKYNGTWCTWLDDELCVKTPIKSVS